MSEQDTLMYDAYESRDLNFNNNISTAAVFLDIEEAFYPTWNPGFLYKLSKLHFSAYFIKQIISFLTENSGFR